MKNTICHVEIPINDEEKANSFYNQVFDWKIDFDKSLSIHKNLNIFTIFIFTLALLKTVHLLYMDGKL